MNNWLFVGFSRILLLGILIFKGLAARRLYRSFGVKGLNIITWLILEQAMECVNCVRLDLALYKIRINFGPPSLYLKCHYIPIYRLIYFNLVHILTISNNFKPLILRGNMKNTLPTLHIHRFCTKLRLSEANIWRWNYTIIS
jgi:hypothetical protein